ncbi:glycosyltransferase family 2 protein [Pseudoalteromonas sp. 1CM17D]|uniref:glycosyltransferase family 2 protein n=1 Tax=Pseudoalteromonas sp. 1CM17D TaxID=2929162 RepID=UPI0020C05BCF|nr:glycosyltransferase family 2 protein [Pseudoalteromonas sp. 1CM17D]MCK8097397.1 glycosyltransferase family 2 protein [Pseudoalteromonas sp. 1CM17D]
MQYIRKSIANLAKFIINYTPNTWVESIKKHPKLVAVYSNNLHKSGLMYQLQTIEEQKASYLAYMKHQNAQMSAQIKSSGNMVCESMLLVCVEQFNSNELFITLASIKAQHLPFSNVIFWCKNTDEKNLNHFLPKHCDFEFVVTSDLVGDARLNKEKTKASFVVYSGDKLDSYLTFALTTHINLDTHLAYFDTDKLSNEREREYPDFKPDWNPDLQLTAGYINSGLWVKTLADFAYGCGTLSAFNVARYMVFCYLNNLPLTIQHIPLVMLSRSSNLVSFANAKAFLEPLYNKVAEIDNSNDLPTLSLRWHLDYKPLVSIIIPTCNAKELVRACIDSILNKSTYTNYEILLVDNNSDDSESLRYFNQLSEHPKITLLTYNKPFNYSAINNFAAKQANGEVLALVNNDIEVISPDWLLNMVSHVMREDIGCVGAKLLYSDKRIQHAGVVMGYGGGAGHGHKYFPGDHHGYMNRLIATQNYSAVTAACLLIKQNDFWAVEGLNEESLAIAFNDVDLCLKVQQLGRRNLYCAEAVLYHHESVSRGYEDTPEKVQRFENELNYLKSTWQDTILSDPAYNPNLTLRRENFSIKPFE